MFLAIRFWLMHLLVKHIQSDVCPIEEDPICKEHNTKAVFDTKKIRLKTNKLRACLINLKLKSQNVKLSFLSAKSFKHWTR